MRAVVLGPGGPVGTAWLAGLASGLRRGGVDLAEADLIVGTSAGAIVGALLATGGDPERFATPPGSADDAPREGDPERLAEVFGVLGEPGAEPVDMRRRVGRLALAARTLPEQDYLARMAFAIGADAWPERRLLIPAVDIESGEPVVWDRAGDAPLAAAVAASTAMPGMAPPITIGGRRYMDGSLRAGTNVDLAADARVVVIAEPLAHRYPASVPEGAGTVVRLVPDAAALDAFGPDLGDRAAWAPSYQAGLRQAPEAAEQARAAWRDGA